MAALSVQARGRSGPGLHTGLLSVRVNTLGSVLNKCHSQWGRSRPSPPARLYADNPSQNPCWSDPDVACGSGVGKAGEERSRTVQAVVSMAVQVTQVFGCVFAKSHMKSLFMLQSFDVRVDNVRTFESLLKRIKKHKYASSLKRSFMLSSVSTIQASDTHGIFTPEAKPF